jgi:Uncharacterized conserved protein (DUF2190)
MAKSNAYHLEHHVTFTETVRLTATVASNRFINRSGAYPANGGYSAGITQQPGVAGDRRTIDTDGISIVEVGAAIATLDTPITSDASGKARPGVIGTDSIIGRALDTATGTGTEFIRVKLVSS